MKSRIARYRQYNEIRQQKAFQFNEAKGTFLFRVVPFLLHSNYPDLPGYVSAEAVPCGIAGFDPAAAVSPDLFQRYFPLSTARRDDTPSPHPRGFVIHSLKTIGSIGTLAQTEKSDCDYWVSIKNDELGEPGRTQLEQKCRGIEEWSLKKGIEVHFFLMDIDETRENRFSSDADQESAGSAIKVLLKDELFRSHILVAGKMLLWWIIPPGLTEQGYRRYVEALFADHGLDPNRYIDLGYLTDIPKAEIFGACLWQMNKALDSPFKSVIKFAYLEILLRRSDETLPLFSDRVKCLVTFPEKLDKSREEIILFEDIDPYLLLAREIVAFYEQTDSSRYRQELIRECLFLKALEGMQSRKEHTADEKSRLQFTMAMMKEWHLLPDDYSHFAAFSSWSFRDLVAFGGQVHGYLLDTYKRLRMIFKKFQDEAGLTITERDLSILGRKLFTYYEKKPDKVEYIRSLSRGFMGQDDITIHIAKQEGGYCCQAFQGERETAAPGTDESGLIGSDGNPVRLFTWLVINGILHGRTRLHLTKNTLPIAQADLKRLTDVLLQTFPLIHFSHIRGDDLLRKERIVRALIVVNFMKLPVRGAKNLHSTAVTANSYGEYFVQEFDTMTQLKNAIHKLLTGHYVSRWNKNLEIFIPPQPEQQLLRSMIDN